MTEHSDAENGTPAVQLRFLIGKFGPNEQNLIRAIRSAMRKRLPTANELVYDYTTFFVVSYSATEHPSDAIAATAARPDGMRLNLMNKQPLPDPNKLLTGSGKQARYVRLESAKQLEHPDVQALLQAAMDRAGVPLPADGRGKLIIRTFGAKKRTRRKPTT